MPIKVEITNIRVTDRAEHRQTLQSLFTGVATITISSDEHGEVVAQMHFEKAPGLDGACTQVYRQLGQWAREVAGQAQNAAGGA